jgi:hypothetical protein
LITGLLGSDYRPGQMTYDLRRLRLAGLIHGSHTPTTTPSPPMASASPSPTPRSTTDCSFRLPPPTNRKHPSSSDRHYAPSTTTSMTTSPGHTSSPQPET